MLQDGPVPTDGHCALHPVQGGQEDVRRPGLSVPCTYTEYKAGATQTMDVGKFGLSLSFGSVVTTVRREYLIYPLLSFVSDLGGSLGLFIGFSFFAMWDILTDVHLIGRHAVK